jgi:hypothetical protein
MTNEEKGEIHLQLAAPFPERCIDPTRTSYRSPRQNGVAERFVGTVRRELLDHVIVLNERHLRQLIKSLVTCYDEDRTRSRSWARGYPRTRRR